MSVFVLGGFFGALCVFPNGFVYEWRRITKRWEIAGRVVKEMRTTGVGLFGAGKKKRDGEA